MIEKQYKDIFDRVDTDTGMDNRIKSKLFYYDPQEEPLKSETNHKEGGQTIFFTPKKVGILRTILPTFAIVVFLVAVLFGINSLLDNQERKGTLVASNSDELGDAITEESDTSTDELIIRSEDLTDDLTEVGMDANPDNIEDADTASNLNNDAILDSDDLDSVPDGDNQGNEVADQIVAKDGDFYFAHFDVMSSGGIKTAIPNLMVRFHGKIDTIDPADLTDIVLTRDGVPIDNSITFTGNFNQFTWGYEDVTDVKFRFQDDNRVPGTYGLTGKYKENSFEVYEKIIEDSISDQPASEEVFRWVGWGWHPDEREKPKRVSELIFHFGGRQNSFYQTDLSDLKMTKDGQEIAVSFDDYVHRYYEYSSAVGGGNTQYNLILTEVFTESGTYMITGKYRGKDFVSEEITIP